MSIAAGCAQGEIVTPGQGGNSTTPDLDMSGAKDQSSLPDDGAGTPNQTTPVDMSGGDQGMVNNTS